MTRLINADALKYTQQVVYKKGDGDEVWAEWFITATEIANAPTIDAEPVIRCKDCEHWDVSENEYSICCHAYHNMMMVRSDGMGFCSDGERKDEEADK